jgi:hypothetical protein
MAGLAWRQAEGHLVVRETTEFRRVDLVLMIALAIVG